MLMPQTMMRLGTMALIVIMGLTGAFYTYASFYYAPYAYYAFCSLGACAALIWVLPTNKPQRKPRKR